VALDPLPLQQDRHDVVVYIGEEPSWVTHALAESARILPTGRSGMPYGGQFSLAVRGTNFFELRYGDGTCFVVDREGTQVWGRPGPKLTSEDALVYLLGPVLGFVLRRRDRLALHASAVGIGNAAVALVGSAGAGKSTTAAALALRGWPVVCEDICSLGEDRNGSHVFPGYPRVCLWPDSVEFLYANAGALPLIVEGWEKRYLPLDGTKAKFAEGPLPLGALYMLAERSDDLAAPSIVPMSAREAALQLVQNTYMNWLIDRDQRAAEFNAVVKLVLATKCFRITPSNDPSRIGELAGRLEAHALSQMSSEQHDRHTWGVASCDV
jgi:hypothetical protein